MPSVADGAPRLAWQVRQLRCKTAVESRRQEDFVREYHEHLIARSKSGGGTGWNGGVPAALHDPPILVDAVAAEGVRLHGDRQPVSASAVKDPGC